MKIYSLYSDSHRILKEKYFEPSLEKGAEITIEKVEQSCPTGTYQSEGWNLFMLKKIDLILRAIAECKGDLFLYSDVDVQFFKPVLATLQKSAEGYDLLVQRDNPTGELCAGFLVCRANSKTRNLWQTVRATLVADPTLDDQMILNQLLVHGPFASRNLRTRVIGKVWWYLFDYLNSLTILPNEFGVRWKFLSGDFMSGGTFTGKVWNPGDDIFVPDTIKVHHANWTIGIENKIAQLDLVKRKVSR